jgi:hypothetical protein
MCEPPASINAVEFLQITALSDDTCNDFYKLSSTGELNPSSLFSTKQREIAGKMNTLAVSSQEIEPKSNSIKIN